MPTLYKVVTKTTGKLCANEEETYWHKAITYIGYEMNDAYKFFHLKVTDDYEQGPDKPCSRTELTKYEVDTQDETTVKERKLYRVLTKCTAVRQEPDTNTDYNVAVKYTGYDKFEAARKYYESIPYDYDKGVGRGCAKTTFTSVMVKE